MGEAKRTTKLAINLDSSNGHGLNTCKREYLDLTKEILDKARIFYCEFFLAHRNKIEEKITYFSGKYQEKRQRLISADELLTWAEHCTVSTKDHPKPLNQWDFNSQFSGMPVVYRRSVIKDSIGRVRSYSCNLKNWETSGKKKGKPGLPTASNHPTLYKGIIELGLEELDYKDAFIRIKVYVGQNWVWINYPVEYSTWQEARLKEEDWERQSPKLILEQKRVEIHIPQSKKVEAQKVTERKKSADLVTLAVDVNVKNLAVMTVRQHAKIIETFFFTDKGLDQHRYWHMRLISKHQWLSGKPVKGEDSNKLIWKHVKRTNEDFAHQASRVIADLCGEYSGCILIFENLRKMKGKKESNSHRLNRKLANQIRGLIRDYSKQKAFVNGIVTVEVNPHGTSTYCSRCGEKGERFSLKNGQEIKYKGGKLFRCTNCGYTANADFNASVNLHHSFYREYHWKPKKEKKQRPATLCTAISRVE